MEIGLITDSLGGMPLSDVLDFAEAGGLSSIEISTGNWSTAPHCDLPNLVVSAAARDELIGQVASHGLRISALNANGNQLHPVTGQRHSAVLYDTIKVASLVGVPTVVCMSGLPSAPNDMSPNWITTSWPPENQEILRYQWDEIGLPYWRELAAFARDHGVRLAVEACFSQLVYNPSTMARLIDAAGSDVVGANLDPSHLMWMGMDIPTVIRALGDSIIHVHAKDMRINRQVADRDGLLDIVPMDDAEKRAWNYVTLGFGQPAGEAFWADFVYTLRSVGYDGTLNIEHEDVLLNALEGVERAASLLKRVVMVKSADWRPAAI